MRVKEEQREMVIERLSAHLLETGLSQISLRQLAAAAGVSDRMLLYYFNDKAEVLATALERIAAGLSVGLAQALPDGATFAPNVLLRRTVAYSVQPDMRRFMRLWIEVVAAAAKGEAPFVSIAAQIMAGFQMWVDSRLDLPPGADRAAIAAGIIAVVDGLALVGICTDDDLVTRAVDAIDALSS